MAIYGSDFTYDGTSLSSIDDDYILVSFEENDSETMYKRTINQSNITNDNYIKYYYGHMADQPITLKLTISRCEDALTKQDAKVLTDWLFANSDPRVLFVTPRTGDFGVFENVDFIGAFTTMNYEANHNAISFTFENISGYAFTKPQTFTIDTGEESSLTITNSGSQAGEVIYPEISVEPNETGTLAIAVGGVSTFSVQMTEGEPFVIRDRNMYKPNGTLYSFENLNNFNWPYLNNGDNVWSFTGDANITVTTRFLVTTGY